MKKKIIVLLAFCLLASAGSALGATTYSTTPTGISGFTPSSNVVVGYAASSGQDVYSIASKHKQGNKCYATTSASTKMYQGDCTPGTDLTTGDLPNTPSSASDSTVTGGTPGWSAM